MSQPFALMVLFVDPLSGNDRGNGSQTQPFKTLTHALTIATPGITTLKLSQGTYSLETGETFPLYIPVGVTVQGDESSKGHGIVISGGGTLLSTDFGKQCVTLTLDDKASLQGVTVTNSNPGGTGVWVESTHAAIAHCTIEHCAREGVFVTGTASVQFSDSVFQHNGASGLSMVRQAKGTVQDSLFRHTGYGLVIGDRASPLLLNNACLGNRIGIVVTRSATPVLRQNLIKASIRDGLMVTDAAQPDLGQPQDPGLNQFSQNRSLDVRHLGSNPLTSAGNLLSPVRVQGAIAFAATQVDLEISQTPQSSTRSPGPFFSTEAVEPTPMLPTLAPAYSAVPPEFVSLDAIADHWAAPYIQALVNQGVFRSLPTGQFQPDQGVTRATYAAVLCRAFGLAGRSRVPDFQDLPEGDWATDAIAMAVQAGFMSGFPDGSVRPHQCLTRWEAIASLVAGLKLTSSGLTPLLQYRDHAEIPSDGAIAIATATQCGLVVNYPNRDVLRPLDLMTQSELAALIYQVWVIRLQAPAISSPYQVPPELIGMPFSDLTGHWAAEFVRRVASQGIMAGYADGTFRPNVPITRADLAVFLAGLFNHLPERPAPGFKDVAPDFWAAAAIARTFRLGLMSEFDDQTFRPNQTVTRLHLILALVNGLDLPIDDTLAEIEAPSYARGAIASAIAHSLVVSFPDPNQLELNRPATRAETAVMLYQALVQQQRATALPSPFLISRPPTAIAEQKRPQQVIVLDPGHGGSDTGAFSPLGFYEKDITLMLCQAIAETLRKQPGLRVILTRIDDHKISHERRLQIAQRGKANLLISVHLSTTEPADPNVNGLRTYYLEGFDPGKAIAQALHNSILKHVQISDQGVASARFPLLRLASMPVVQLDVGYATGSEDGQRLADPVARAQLAKAIAESIQPLVMPNGSLNLDQIG